MNTAQREKNIRRRKANAADGVTGRRLGVNRSQLDFDNFAYRWVNDTPARIFAMTKEDDWDMVSNDGKAVKEDASDLGNAVSVVVGTAPDGSALKAYLCRKPKAFYVEDQAAKSAQLDTQLEQIKRGNARDGSSQGDYVPSGGIKVAQGA